MFTPQSGQAPAQPSLLSSSPAAACASRLRKGKIPEPAETRGQDGTLRLTATAARPEQSIDQAAAR